jgi:hypothetical protein
MAIRIDADALFRAITASGFKLLAYHLNVDTGEIGARTLRPDEVPDAPQGPSVKPLPKIGGDLTPKKDALPFGPAPDVQIKKKLFNDDTPKKSAFDSEFFKREQKQRNDIFRDGGFRRESGPKKLAEIFSQPQPKKPADPFAKPAESAKPAPVAPGSPPLRGTAFQVVDTGKMRVLQEGETQRGAPAPDDPKHPRIPVAAEAQQIEWMETFARECGDPEIRDQLLKALKSAKPTPSFERTLRKYQRMNQQWDRYYRKTALAEGVAWLATLGVEWELIESK